MASEDDHLHYLSKAATLKKIKHNQNMLVNNTAYSRISLNHIQQKTDLLTIALSSDQEETPVDCKHDSRLNCIEW